MRTVLEYRYTYFTIFRMWGHAGSVWPWVMDEDELADATLYKGPLRIARAYDTRIEGTVLRGFVDFRRKNPEWSQYLQYQLCVNDEDAEWFCLHGYRCTLETSYLQFVGNFSVPANTSFVLLEGSATLDDLELNHTLVAMTHFKPRPHSIRAYGVGKGFLIKKHGPLQPSRCPPGVADVNAAMSALRELVVQYQMHDKSVV